MPRAIASRSTSAASGDVAGVDLEDLEPALLGRPIDGDVAVEPAGAQQGRIEHVGPVGRRQHDHALAGREAVHLGQDLVERLLALVVAAAQPAPRTRPTASISSMNRMQGLFSLAVLNMSRTRLAPTPTNIWMNSEPEIEKNGTPASPATARASSVLPVPGGPFKQHALGNPPAQPLELLGVLEELDDLLELGLGVLQAGHFVERGALLRLVVPLRRALDEAAQDPAVELVAGPPHHQVDEAEDHERRQEKHDPGQAVGRVGRAGIDLDPVRRFFSSAVSFASAASLRSRSSRTIGLIDLLGREHR